MSAQVTNVIQIGKKPVQNYALAVQFCLKEGASTVTFRARGEAIVTALDAANMAIRLDVPVQRGEVRWGSETGRDGKPCSWVEVDLLAVAS